LAEVLLYIEMATELAIGCQPEDIHCRCCFVLTGEIYFVEEVVVADIDLAYTSINEMDITWCNA
jgi:hypothetical protein